MNFLKNGQLYKHFKGNVYQIVNHSVMGATDPNTLFVVYRSSTDGTLWMREQEEFMGFHENGQKRFELLGEE
jgi:hypothetical protein